MQFAGHLGQLNQIVNRDALLRVRVKHELHNAPQILAVVAGDPVEFASLNLDGET